MEIKGNFENSLKLWWRKRSLFFLSKRASNSLFKIGRDTGRAKWDVNYPENTLPNSGVGKMSSGQQEGFILSTKLMRAFTDISAKLSKTHGRLRQAARREKGWVMFALKCWILLAKKQRKFLHSLFEWLVRAGDRVIRMFLIMSNKTLGFPQNQSTTNKWQVPGTIPGQLCHFLMSH